MDKINIGTADQKAAGMMDSPSAPDRTSSVQQLWIDLHQRRQQLFQQREELRLRIETLTVLIDALR